jgi:ribosomal protein S4E
MAATWDIGRIRKLGWTGGSAPGRGHVRDALPLSILVRSLTSEP